MFAPECRMENLARLSPQNAECSNSVENNSSSGKVLIAQQPWRAPCTLKVRIQVCCGTIDVPPAASASAVQEVPELRKAARHTTAIESVKRKAEQSAKDAMVVKRRGRSRRSQAAH